MRQGHEHLVQTVIAERDRLFSRRGLLVGGAKLGIGGAVALAIAGSPRFNLTEVLAQEMDFEDDIAVLNYALTLEHLEYSFYRDGIDQYDLGTDPFGNSIFEFMTQIRDHEKAHVDTLTSVINDLGGEPVEEATYDFGYTDAVSFRMTAAALENTGVSAYDGAARFIKDAGLLTAAGSIVAVEARHAAYLNVITGVPAAPDSFETAKSKAEILEIAGPFIVA